MTFLPSILISTIQRGYSVKKFVLFVFLLSLACSGCSSSTGHHFTSPAIGLGYIKHIAVLPLENFTKDKGIEDRARNLLTTKLLGHELYGIVEQGELHRFLQGEVRSKDKALIDQAIAKRMARTFNIEAYMTGSIDDYKQVRSGSYSYPVIAMTLRMIDIKTGTVVWQASADASGYSTAGRLFGISSEETNAVLFRLIDNLLNTMNDS